MESYLGVKRGLLGAENGLKKNQIFNRRNWILDLLLSFCTKNYICNSKTL